MAPADFSAKDYLQRKLAGPLGTLGGIGGLVGGAVLGHELGGQFGDAAADSAQQSFDENLVNQLRDARISDDHLPGFLHEPVGQLEDQVNRAANSQQIQDAQQRLNAGKDLARTVSPIGGAFLGGGAGAATGAAVGRTVDEAAGLEPKMAEYLRAKRAAAEKKDKKDEKPSGKDIAKGMALAGGGAALGVSGLHLSGLSDAIKDTVREAMQ